MSSALQEFVQLLVGGIQDLASGIATGVANMARDLFLEYTESQGVITVTGLSVFGGIVAIFAGLALAIGITTRVYTWVTSLGN